MSWASAGGIFDPIAEALIELDAPEATKRRVLGPLIAKLQGEDWDTEYASLKRFRDDPVIVDLFREHGVDDEEE